MRRLTAVVMSGLIVTAGMVTPLSAVAAPAKAKPPHVTKVSPAKGSVGATVTVKGSGFVKVKKVLFGTKAAHFTVHSSTSLTVKAPSHGLGAVNIRVVIKGHTSAKAKADRFTYIAPPPAVTITKVSPSTGGAAGDSPIVITGRGFTVDALVSVGGTVGSAVNVDSSTKITLDTPAHAAGTVDVRVKDDKGTTAATAADHYTYVATPYSATPVNQAQGDETDEFGPVACGAPGSCVAGGITDVDAAEGDPAGVLDTLASGTWTTTRMKLPSDAGSDNPWDESGPPAVSCGAAGSCVAVDNYQTNGFVTEGVIDTLADGVWTTATAPAPSNANDENPHIDLNGVTCLSATSCVAVGSFVDASGFQNPLVETLSGTQWTAAKVAPPSNVDVSDDNAASLLTDISCSSATSCAAYGTYVDSDDSTQRWLAALSSGAWHATEAPLPANDDASEDAQDGADFASISCPASGACFAVSFYVTTDGATEPLIEKLSGTTWTDDVAPVPSAAATGDTAVSGLSSVDCTSATACVAVGSYGDNDGNTFGLIDILSGTAWSASKAPAPSNNASESIFTPLRSVVCPAAGSCTATGDFTDTHDDPGAVIDTLAGGTWTSRQGVTPATSDPNGASLVLRDLACPTQASCVAAGSFENNNGDPQGMVETHN